MDILDSQGKTVHYSGSWESITFVSGIYKPKKSFRIYTPTLKTLVLKGVNMNRADAIAISLTEGYHNLVCDEVIEAGSDSVDGVLALF